MMTARDESPFTRKLLAVGVHLYTSMGIIVAFATVVWIVNGDYRSAFLGMFLAVVIDATDGTMARAIDVRRHIPWIDGRKLDDIVDYVNYTFVPMLLVWHAKWVPQPAWLFCAIPLVSSSFAFVHEGAKEERRGFFRGFPSYWNIVAFYIAVMINDTESWLTAFILIGLSGLTVAPIRFVYPNRPPCWKLLFLGGAVVWGSILLVILAEYPDVSFAWVAGSLVYPILYVVLSAFLDARDRIRQSERV